jgi:hypothetical protein
MAFPVIGAALGLVSFAPIIARWLGGDPAQEIAAKVVSIAQKVTGALDPMEALQRLQNNTDMVSEFQRSVIQMEAEIELALMKDRQEARVRDVALVNAGRLNRRANWMVIGAAAGLVLCLLMLAFFSKELPGEVGGAILTIGGIFGGCLKDAYNFEFGSSRGSKEKDDSIAALIERNDL